MDVDGTMADLLAGRDVERHIEALAGLHGASRREVAAAFAARTAPGAPVALRKAAFFALQHCWDTAACAPLVERLTDPSPEVRRMAAIVLDRAEGREFLARAAKPLLVHPDPSIAAEAFERVESMYPEIDRMRAALANKSLRPHLARLLSRYYAPDLAPACRDLLDDADLTVARAGVVALIEQADSPPPTRERVAPLLHHELNEARELAAEFCLWHGDGEMTVPLRQAMKVEPDLWARSAMAAAIGAIEARGGGSPVFPAAEPMEPRWLYEGRSPSPEFIRERREIYRARLRALGLPGRTLFGSDRDRTGTPPPATVTVVAPVREYYDRDGESYGEKTGTVSRVFTDLIHIGDDVGWDREHLAVVAIAAGVVREVAWLESWGNLIVIEHRLPAALFAGQEAVVAATNAALAEPCVDVATRVVTCCSLYAHLGPAIMVRPGEHVAAGRKLGAIGRHYTWENGGYRAHLHFGLHLGGYEQRPLVGSDIDMRFEGRHHRARVLAADGDRIDARIETDRGPLSIWRPAGWARGYVPAWWFAEHSHGWIDPRMLLQRSET